MNELLPCPFCGGEAQHYEDGYMQHYIVCTNRGCYARSFGFEFEDEAIAAWNSRAERTCRNADDHKTTWFICSECGRHWYVSKRYNYCPSCGRKVVGE